MHAKITPTTWLLVVAYLVSGTGVCYLLIRSDDASMKAWLPVVFGLTFYCCARRILVSLGR